MIFMETDLTQQEWHTMWLAIIAFIEDHITCACYFVLCTSLLVFKYFHIGIKHTVINNFYSSGQRREQTKVRMYTIYVVYVFFQMRMFYIFLIAIAIAVSIVKAQPHRKFQKEKRIKLFVPNCRSFRQYASLWQYASFWKYPSLR